MYDSKWASGIKWFNSILHPTFFFVQGEVIYLFLVMIYFPSVAFLKFILITIGLMMIAKVLGFSLKQLVRRWFRYVIGKKRPIYSLNDNKKRFLSGI
jgi:hypothetical protein